MKKWIFLFILINMVVNLNNQAPQKRLHIHEQQFRSLYPQWDAFSEETKYELYSMFERSSNKHNWFPEEYSAPKRNKAIIRPRGSLYREYLDKGGESKD